MKFPRATAEADKSDGWVLCPDFLMRVKSQDVGGERGDYPGLVQIETVLLAVEAVEAVEGRHPLSADCERCRKPDAGGDEVAALREERDELKRWNKNKADSIVEHLHDRNERIDRETALREKLGVAVEALNQIQTRAGSHTFALHNRRPGGYSEIYSKASSALARIEEKP